MSCLDNRDNHNLCQSDPQGSLIAQWTIGTRFLMQVCLRARADARVQRAKEVRQEVLSRAGRYQVVGNPLQMPTCAETVSKGF